MQTFPTQQNIYWYVTVRKRRRGNEEWTIGDTGKTEHVRQIQTKQIKSKQTKENKQTNICKLKKYHKKKINK